MRVITYHNLFSRKTHQHRYTYPTEACSTKQWYSLLTISNERKYRTDTRILARALFSALERAELFSRATVCARGARLKCKLAWDMRSAHVPCQLALQASIKNLIVPGDALQQVAFDLVERQADLRHAVALADSHGLVVQCLEIDSHAEGRTNFVLAAITAPDIGDIVILRDHRALQLLVERFGRLDQFRLVLLQGQHSDLDRGNPRVQAQHRARLLAARIWLFLVGVEQQVQEGAIDAAGSLDNPGDVALFGLRIGVAQVLAAVLAVAREIPVLAPVDAFPLLPAQDGAILDIKGLPGVVSQLIGLVRAQAQAILVVDQVLVPLKAEGFPVLKPLRHLAG